MTHSTRHPGSNVRRLENGRPDLVAFEIGGRLDATDMRWMADEVAEAFGKHGRIDMLVVFRRFDGATAGAAFEPKALKVELSSVVHVRRYGVVGAPAWADAMIAVGGLVTPIEARTFDQDEEAEARAWIDRPLDYADRSGSSHAPRP
jgi:hypothetical protein